MRPSWASSMKTGTNDTMMIAREKKIARPTCCAAALGRLADAAVRVLDDDDRRVHQLPDRKGDSAEGHDVRRDPQVVHGDERHDHGDRQRDDRYQRRAEMEQE